MGEPEGCSGKTNAILTEIQVATHGLVVCVDDDLHHPSD
ncbi:MAG: hypothetical protein J07HX64_02222 [halophilic archaeon J07HX64]|nr:MAG: hypothetical protein J07HX64_02222 [halophilic archaeon J07HX64]